MATELVEEQQEFYPFGYVVKADGGVVNVAVYEGATQPESKQLIDVLIAAFRKRAEAREIIASAICCDVFVTEHGKKHDSFRVSLEHRDGDSLNVFLPYERSPTGEILHGELSSTNTVATIFS